MSASTADEFTASCLEIWEQVRTATDNAGRERAELFMKYSEPLNTVQSADSTCKKKKKRADYFRSQVAQ